MAHLPAARQEARSASLVRLDHELIDAGDGRRLDRFGERVVDRPSPAAVGLRRADPRGWQAADLRWERSAGGGGRWWPGDALGLAWQVRAGSFRLEMRPTSSGQLGCFPEHAPTWDWLARWSAAEVAAGRPCRILHLFAYTGGATLAAAAAGAAVTHVDAQRTVVAWARRNAAISGLQDAPVRWIVDDAVAFAGREVRRGRRYEAVVLDPPSYGHGPGGRTWQIAEALPGLLQVCLVLGGEESGNQPLGGEAGLRALLLTCHSPGLGPQELATLVRGAWPGLAAGRLEAGPLELRTRDGRALPAGASVRVGPP